MIVADRPDLEVLMVQRTARAVFGPSAWVFPGGRVDVDDQSDIDDVVEGLDDPTASAMLGVVEHGRAWWLAGLRETLEEAGLLLGVDGAALAAVERARSAVHVDAGNFLRALRDNELRIDLSAIHEVARFITPLGPPRRFDTRFMVAAAPDGQTAMHDEEEVVQHRWIRPCDAIERFRDGRFPLMSVTHRMLACLDRYESTAALLHAAAQRLPEQRVRVNDPNGAYEVVLPGEPGYETADVEIEHGWVRI